MPLCHCHAGIASVALSAWRFKRGVSSVAFQAWHSFISAGQRAIFEYNVRDFSNASGDFGGKHDHICYTIFRIENASLGSAHVHRF